MSLSVIKRGLSSIWAAGFVLFAAIAPAHAQDLKFPDLNGHRVVDQANILSDATEQDLDLKLKGLEDATTDQLVVVTVDSLQDQDIETYGYQLGRHWGIGQNGTEKAPNGQTYKDNGILLIVAPNEHKVRIEVGYGLEGVMTDAMSGLIIRHDITPQFKAGNYDKGVEDGVDAIIQQLSIDRGVAIQKAQAAAQEQDDTSSNGHIPIGFIILIVIFILLFSRGWLPWLILGQVLGSGNGRGGGWGGGGGGFGGGGGGGGFSGGGGSFGGGGSSGSW